MRKVGLNRRAGRWRPRDDEVIDEAAGLGAPQDFDLPGLEERMGAVMDGVLDGAGGPSDQQR